MEVAEVRQGLAVLGRPPGVGDGPRLAVLAEGVERDELRAVARALESELGPAQHLPARRPRRT